MATPVVTSTPIQSELSAFSHKVLYAHLGVIILLLALIGTGGYLGLKSYDKALAHAEALQAQFSVAQAQATASQKQLTDLLAQDAQLRAKESAQQATLEQQIVKRDSTPPAPAVAAALAPSADSKELVLGLQASYADFNGFGAVQADPAGNIVLVPSQARDAVIAHEAEKQYVADLHDENQLFTLEQSKSTSLSNDLTQCKATESQYETALAAANKSIAAFKKAAGSPQSKFRKVLGSIGRNAERVGILVVGLEIGHRL
jgi:hypothetical protein